MSDLKMFPRPPHPPCGELDECVLHSLSDLQQEGLVLAQRVVPVLDVVPQGKLDHLSREQEKKGKLKAELTDKHPNLALKKRKKKNDKKCERNCQKQH